MTDADTPGPGELGYADAMAELETILHELERGDVDLDRLSDQVRRAADLVRLCRGRLDDTRTEVTRIVADLDGEADPRADDRAAP
jgi:exodeoxyribonuclease VII small subunit